MKRLLILMMLVCIIAPVSGNYITGEIRSTAFMLSGENDTVTINNVIAWINDNIEYEFYYSPRGDLMTWIDRRGDCTDTSHLISTMLSYNNIYTEPAHGYAYYFTPFEIRAYYHDWLEYNGAIIDAFPAIDYVKLGNGFW